MWHYVPLVCGSTTHCDRFDRSCARLWDHRIQVLQVSQTLISSYSYSNPVAIPISNPNHKLRGHIRLARRMQSSHSAVWIRHGDPWMWQPLSMAGRYRQCWICVYMMWYDIHHIWAHLIFSTSRVASLMRGLDILMKYWNAAAAAPRGLQFWSSVLSIFGTVYGTMPLISLTYRHSNALLKWLFFPVPVFSGVYLTTCNDCVADFILLFLALF